jgi:hypothetical protein
LVTGKGSKRRVRRHIDLPVANTVFVNGQRSTLFEEHWAVQSDRSTSTPPSVIYNGRHSLKHFQIPTGCGADGFLGGHVPVEALTPERKVVRSMGNVLGEIEIDGRAVPASQELEKAVSNYLASHPEHAVSGPIAVYALIRRAGDSSVDEAQGSQQNTTNRGSEVDSAIWRGAKLYKVTGGGGGWGKRQGLLSLEPATDFESPADTMTFPDLDDDFTIPSTMGSQNMIPEDSAVQFWVYSGDENAHRDSTAADPKQPPDPDRHLPLTLLLGTASQPESRTHPQSPDGAGVEFLPDRFGMISYGGAALGFEETPASGERFSQESEPFKSSRTRLDVPNSSYVLSSHRGKYIRSDEQQMP